MYAEFDEDAHNSPYRVHKVTITIYVQRDLWPWTSKINVLHPLVIVNMSATFDEEVHNSLVSVKFTRSKLDGWNHSIVTIWAAPRKKGP